MRILLRKDLTAKVWVVAAPVVLGMISQTLMNVVDTAMVGRLGAVALAAVGLGGMLSWMVLGALAGVNIGVQSVTSRRFGEGDRTAAGRVLDNGLVIALLLGLLCSSLIAIGMREAFAWFSNDPAVVSDGQGYIYNRLLSGLPFMLIQAHRGFFNGIGRTRLHMQVVIVNNILNVLLNYLLIFGNFGFPRLEAAGAGLATTLANAVGALYFITIALQPAQRNGFGYYKPANLSRTVARGIMRLAVPTGLQSLLVMAGFAVFSGIVARIGTIELAATNVCITVMSLSFLPGAGIGTAAASLIGQKLGEGRPDRAEELGWEAVRLGMVLMGSIGLLFIAVPDLIIGVFTDDQSVVAAGRIPLRVIGFVQVFDAMGMVLAWALQGAGMNRWVLLAEVAVNWGLFIPGTVAAVFFFNLGLIGAWGMMALYVLVFGMVVSIKFAGGTWKGTKV